MRPKWECILCDGHIIYINRLEVPGGWLVCCTGDGGYSGLTFYPDPEHTWKP